MIFDVLKLNPQHGFKEIDLKFPQPEWWILRVLVWFWVSFFYSLSWLIRFNLAVLGKTLSYTAIYAYRMSMALVDQQEGNGWLFIKNMGHFVSLTTILFFYGNIILPIELYVLKQGFSTFSPMFDFFNQSILREQL